MTNTTTETLIEESGDVLLDFTRGKITRPLAAQRLALVFFECSRFADSKDLKAHALVLAAAMGELYTTGAINE